MNENLSFQDSGSVFTDDQIIYLESSNFSNEEIREFRKQEINKPITKRSIIIPEDWNYYFNQ